MSEEPRFTVEEMVPDIRGQHGVGTHGIRYTPAPKRRADGATFYGVSFLCLLAGDRLANQPEILQQVADVLNASEIGKGGT